MTREEILDKYYRPKMHWNCINRTNVLAAMDEYKDQETSALRAENERLRGLIKSAFFKAHLVGGDNYYLEKDWNKFESENNLQYGLPT